MPLCRPALAALATLEFTWLYNDFFWAVVLLNQGDQRPITSSIANLGGQFFTDDNLIAAASMIIAVPTLVVYLALQTTLHQRPDPRRQQGLNVLPLIGQFRPWLDPTITGIGRLPMHVPLSRSRRRSLDGSWSFKLYDHPDSVPQSAITGDHPTTTVTVPGNWTMQDTGDHPHYTNIQMPFPGPPPVLPERVTTGVYRTTFTMPRAWKGTQIVLHVAGAESVQRCTSTVRSQATEPTAASPASTTCRVSSRSAATRSPSL